MLGLIFIGWFVVVYLFSSQNGKESSKVSEEVTKELLRLKDTLVVVVDHYKDTNELVLKRRRN